MNKRVWALLLALGVNVFVPGCGDDDDTGDGRSGGASGSGADGEISVAEALGGACTMQQMTGAGGSAASCEGIEEYNACAQQMCSAQQCIDTVCRDYAACVEAAADPCMSNCPAPTGECAMCLGNIVSCTLNNCLGLIMCGQASQGGACDTLDACCARQADAMQKTLCMQLASAARAAGGDPSCMLAARFCM
jgi:hypothetical protein